MMVSPHLAGGEDRRSRRLGLGRRPRLAGDEVVDVELRRGAAVLASKTPGGKREARGEERAAEGDGERPMVGDLAADLVLAGLARRRLSA